MEAITELERVAARHWRGTEEEWLGGWQLRAAEGFTGRANSALPLGDPGMPLDDALTAVTRWYRARGLPPMVAVPLPLDGDSPGQRLDDHLSERTWATRPGPALVMVAGLATAPVAPDLPAGTEFRVDAERALRFPLLAPLPLPRRSLAGRATEVATRRSRVLRRGRGSRYVCHHGYPCVQRPVSSAKRAGRR